MALYFSLINHRSVPLMVQAFDPRDVHNIHLFLLGQSCRAAPIAVSDHNSKSLRCANRVCWWSCWNVGPRVSTVIKPCPHSQAVHVRSDTGISSPFDSMVIYWNFKGLCSNFWTPTSLRTSIKKCYLVRYFIRFIFF